MTRRLRPSHTEEARPNLETGHFASSHSITHSPTHPFTRSPHRFCTIQSVIRVCRCALVGPPLMECVRLG